MQITCVLRGSVADEVYPYIHGFGEWCCEKKREAKSEEAASLNELDARKLFVKTERCKENNQDKWEVVKLLVYMKAQKEYKRK